MNRYEDGWQGGEERCIAVLHEYENEKVGVMMFVVSVRCGLPPIGHSRRSHNSRSIATQIRYALVVLLSTSPAQLTPLYYNYSCI